MKKIKMYYYVPDAEHNEDVSYAENELEEMGANIIDSDITWNDDEIEEAIIYIEVPEDTVQEFVNFGCYKR